MPISNIADLCFFSSLLHQTGNVLPLGAVSHSVNISWLWHASTRELGKGMRHSPYLHFLPSSRKTWRRVWRYQVERELCFWLPTMRWARVFFICTSLCEVLLLSPFYKCGNRGPERLNHQPKVAQPGRNVEQGLSNSDPLQSLWTKGWLTLAWIKLCWNM